MRTSIATVGLSGTLDQKLVAVHEAGFDGVEIFEPDLVASPHSPHFLHFYTPPIGTVLLEVVERPQGYDGYGALNAPVQPQREVGTGASE